MDKEQKKKLEELKKQAQMSTNRKKLQGNVLLQECFAALESYNLIENDGEIKRIVDLAYSSDVEIHSHNNQVFLEDEEMYYIVWDEATLPIVMCSGKRIKESWDDVLAVAFNTYFVAKSTGRTVVIKH